MSDQGEQRYLSVEQVGTLRLSEAIRIGARALRETRRLYLGNGCGCVIGSAYYGATGKTNLSPMPGHDYTETVAIKLGAPLSVAREAENRFQGWNEFSGKPQTREQIADWLETKGL